MSPITDLNDFRLDKLRDQEWETIKKHNTGFADVILQLNAELSPERDSLTGLSNGILDYLHEMEDRHNKDPQDQVHRSLMGSVEKNKELSFDFTAVFYSNIIRDPADGPNKMCVFTSYRLTTSLLFPKLKNADIPARVVEDMTAFQGDKKLAVDQATLFLTVLDALHNLGFRADEYQCVDGVVTTIMVKGNDACRCVLYLYQLRETVLVLKSRYIAALKNMTRDDAMSHGSRIMADWTAVHNGGEIVE